MSKQRKRKTGGDDDGVAKRYCFFSWSVNRMMTVYNTYTGAVASKDDIKMHDINRMSDEVCVTGSGPRFKAGNEKIAQLAETTGTCTKPVEMPMWRTIEQNYGPLISRGVLAQSDISATISIRGDGDKTYELKNDDSIAMARLFASYERSKDSTFDANFWIDFKRALSRENQVALSSINSLDDVDFGAIEPFDPKELDEFPAFDLQIHDKHGFAVIDGTLKELENYITAPPHLVDRGPNRGRYVPVVDASTVTLNLSKDAPIPDGFSKSEYFPGSMWTSKWYDNVNGRWRYVTLMTDLYVESPSQSPTVTKRQKKSDDGGVKLAGKGKKSSLPEDVPQSVVQRRLPISAYIPISASKEFSSATTLEQSDLSFDNETCPTEDSCPAKKQFVVYEHEDALPDSVFDALSERENDLLPLSHIVDENAQNEIMIRVVVSKFRSGTIDLPKVTDGMLASQISELRDKLGGSSELEHEDDESTRLKRLILRYGEQRHL